MDLTASDAVLALAFWPAVLLGPRPFSPELRTLLWLNAVYQALTIFTLIANPFRANLVEWFHAWLLISGALIVGWAVAASGRARLGLSLFLLACLGLGLSTIVYGLLQYAGGDFGAVYPEWPWPMHKNFIGSLLSLAAIVVYARPSWLGWRKSLVMLSLVVFIAAVAMSQARQALIGLAIGVLIVALRQHGERRRAVLALVTVVPIGYATFTMVRDQMASDNQHNSWFQRLDWYEDSMEIWREQFLVGHGLRYWTQHGAPGTFQPPNAFLDVAASTGLAGLVAFVVFWIGVVVVLWRMDPAHGTLALALALSRIGQAQFDLYWVSISASVPFLLVGLCLGAAHVDRLARQVPGSPSSRRTKEPVTA